jgi:hypothetical protein
MAIRLCPNCWSSQLRVSRFRLLDFVWLLMLQMPVRCKECQQRFHSSLYFALKKGREVKRARQAAPATRD